MVELCSIKLGLAVSAHRSSSGRSIVGLRFRSESDADDASDASKTKASPPLNPLPEPGVTLVTLSESDRSQKIQNLDKEEGLVSSLGEEKTKIQTPVDESVISDTPGSETEFKSVISSITKRHEASLERGTSSILPQGTKVRCTHRNWAGDVFAHRVKEFAKPNGKIERVLQYYVDFGDNKFQWRDGDLLEVVPQAGF